MRRRARDGATTATPGDDGSRRSAGQPDLADHRRQARRSVGPASPQRKRRGVAEPVTIAAAPAPETSAAGGDGGGPLTSEAAGSGSWPFVEALDSFVGTTVDLARSSIARWAFVEELKTHPRLPEEFNRWIRDAGLLEPVMKCAELEDLRAQLLGLPDRAAIAEALYSGDDAGLALLDQLTASVEASPESSALRSRIEGMLDEAGAQLRDRTRASVRVLWPSVRGLIQELVKPGWPWLASELYLTFYSLITGYVAGCGVLVQSRTESANPAPVVASTFHSRPGETEPQAYARWEMEKAKVEAAFARSRVPTPQRLQNPEKIIRAARTYYRWRVLGRTEQELAEAYCVEAGHRQGADHWRDDRKTITRDIEIASALFEMGRGDWASLGELS